MKFKRHPYTSHVERALHFGAGLFGVFVLNTAVLCGLPQLLQESIPNYPFDRTFAYVFLSVLGLLNILAFVYLTFTRYWIAIGIVGGLILNELIWLRAGIYDPWTFVMPFWALVGYD